MTFLEIKLLHVYVLASVIIKIGQVNKINRTRYNCFLTQQQEVCYQLKGRVIFTGSGKLISTPKHSGGAQTKEPTQPLQILQTVRPFVGFHAFFDHPRNLYGCGVIILDNPVVTLEGISLSVVVLDSESSHFSCRGCQG